jgi:hypothetical protein
VRLPRISFWIELLWATLFTMHDFCPPQHRGQSGGSTRQCICNLCNLCNFCNLCNLCSHVHFERTLPSTSALSLQLFSLSTAALGVEEYTPSTGTSPHPNSSIDSDTSAQCYRSAHANTAQDITWISSPNTKSSKYTNLHLLLSFHRPLEHRLFSCFYRFTARLSTALFLWIHFDPPCVCPVRSSLWVQLGPLCGFV